jgi:hypothetical protein
MLRFFQGFAGGVRFPPGVLVALKNPTFAGYSKDFYRSRNVALLGDARRRVTCHNSDEQPSGKKVHQTASSG